MVIKLFVLRPEVFQKGTLQPGEKTHTHKQIVALLSI